MQPTNRLYLLLALSFLVETLCISYALHIPAITGLCSILYSLTGIAIAIVFLFIPQYPAAPQSGPQRSIKWILLSVALLAMCWLGNQRILAEPMNYQSADMLPIITIMNERFIAGHWSHVYDPIPEIWQGTIPIYLPAMWLPFSIPVMLGIDPRWLTVICLFVVVALAVWRLRVSKYSLPVLTGMIILLAWLFIDEIPGLLPFSEEGIVILYYVLLVIALQKDKPWLAGIMIALCMLSRYSLIGWLPALLLFLCWKKDWKKLWQLFVGGLATVIVLVMPFGWKPIASLAALPNTYIAFAGRVWHDSPELFTEGAGLARFFGPQNISLQHVLLISCSLLLPPVTTLVILLNEKKWRAVPERIPIAMLKLALVIFYSLVDVPYLYLFYTSSFVSLIIMAFTFQGIARVKR